MASPRARRAFATRTGAWRVGGLLGALLFSVACWTLIYHGVASVIAWTKPQPVLASAAVPAGPHPATPR